MDAIAIKIFAAQHKVSEEAAQNIMYMHGLADEYIKTATVLEPVFNEAFEDGQELGAEAVGVAAELAMFHAQRQVKSGEEYAAGFRDGSWAILTAVRDAVDEISGPVELDTDVILDHIPAEIANGKTLEEVFKAFFSSVTPAR
jgi:hypothetical protein